MPSHAVMFPPDRIVYRCNLSAAPLPSHYASEWHRTHEHNSHNVFLHMTAHRIMRLIFSCFASPWLVLKFELPATMCQNKGKKKPYSFFKYFSRIDTNSNTIHFWLLQYLLFFFVWLLFISCIYFIQSFFFLHTVTCPCVDMIIKLWTLVYADRASCGCKCIHPGWWISSVPACPI